MGLQIPPKPIFFTTTPTFEKSRANLDFLSRKIIRKKIFSIQYFELFSFPETAYDAQTVSISVCALYNTYVRYTTVRLTRWWLQIPPKSMFFLQQHQHWRNHAQTSRFCRKNYSKGNFSIQQFELFSLPETAHDTQTVFISVFGSYNTYASSTTVRLTKWWLQIPPKPIFFCNNTNI